MTAAGEAHGLFMELTGVEPTGLWSAPGRVNLIGEHTDYNDGFVFPFAIDHRTSVALGRRADDRIRVTSTFDTDAVEIALGELDAVFPARRDEIVEWARYPLGVAWALLRQTGATGLTGVDLAIASDVPVGAGLSSSAAIESATAAALDEVWELGLDRVALARRPDGRRRTTRSAPPPESWTRWHPCSGGRMPASSWTAARSRPTSSTSGSPRRVWNCS